MDFHYVHLLTTHIPVIGVPIAVMLFGFGLWLGKVDLKKAGYALFAVVGLAALPVYFTGEPAEHKVEDTPLVSESVIEEHEQAGEFAVYFSTATGLLGLIGLWIEAKRSRTKLSKVFSVTTLVIGLWTCTVLARTAYLGGKIRRPELRGETVEPIAPEADDFEEVVE